MSLVSQTLLQALGPLQPECQNQNGRHSLRALQRRQQPTPHPLHLRLLRSLQHSRHNPALHLTATTKGQLATPQGYPHAARLGPPASLDRHLHRYVTTVPIHISSQAFPAPSIPFHTPPQVWCWYANSLLPTADIKHAGVGLHQCHIPPSQLRLWAIFLYALSHLYMLAVVPPRLAILSLYMHTFGIHRPTGIACYALDALILADLVTGILLLSVLCRPLQKLWDLDVQGKCIDINAILRASRQVNIVIDVGMLFLPVPHVLRPCVQVGGRIGVLAAFGAGNGYVFYHTIIYPRALKWRYPKIEAGLCHAMPY
ncbi:hypothetical protein BDW74DRAFT_153281 [Aspergillus multicolor]|uniref:uncharacterized protein n=1 Tax=Aspergillus multicolor TaxID=41759 RepID=UPI003CCD26FA